MAARKLCRETKMPSLALFYFPDEDLNGIGPTRKIFEKSKVAVGNKVTVNWEGKVVPAEILALSDNVNELNEKDPTYSAAESNTEVTEVEEPLAKKPRAEKTSTKKPRKKTKEGKSTKENKPTEKKQTEKKKKEECRVLFSVDPPSTVEIESGEEDAGEENGEQMPSLEHDLLPPASPTASLNSSISLSSIYSEPQQTYLDDILAEDVSLFTGEEKLNRILENQNNLFRLVSDLFREVREGKCYSCNGNRAPMPSLGRELSNNSSLGIWDGNDISENLGREIVFSNSCVGQDISVGDKGNGEQKSGRLSTISVGDIAEGRVGSASSNNSSLGDGGDMGESLVEEGESFLREAVKIKSSSCSVGNFARKLVQVIFQPGELEGCNCSGTRGKRLLNQGKLDIVRKYVFKLYPCGQAQEDAQWRKCVVAIDEFLRRSKGKVVREQ